MNDMSSYVFHIKGDLKLKLGPFQVLKSQMKQYFALMGDEVQVFIISTVAERTVSTPST